MRSRSKEQPKKIIQMAAVSTDDGPALYALTEEGEIYEYVTVEDKERKADIGMWDPLSTIETKNIVDADLNDDDDEEEEEEE